MALTLGVSRAGGFFCEHSGSVPEKNNQQPGGKTFQFDEFRFLHCGLVACKPTVNL